MDMSFLTRLLSMNPEQMSGLASRAAMQSAPPQLPGPGPAGILAPGAFAGILDPSIGAVPPGMQSPLPPIPNAATPGATPTPKPQIGLDANQAQMLAGLGQQQPLHFPGVGYFQRPGAVQTSGVNIPQMNMARPSLAHILGG